METKVWMFLPLWSKNVQSVTWYVEMQSIAAFVRPFRAPCQRTLPAQTTILRCIKNFSKHKERWNRFWAKAIPSFRTNGQKVKYCSRQNQKRPLKKQISCTFRNSLPHNTNQSEKGSLCVLENDNSGTSVTATASCSKNCLFLVVCEQNFVWTRFLTSDRFAD